MQRLYKFFAVLALSLFAISLVYGTAITKLIYMVSVPGQTERITGHIIPFTVFMRLGLYHAIIYSSVCFLIILLLLRRALKTKSPFSVRKMLAVIVLFFAVTSLAYAFQLMLLSKGNLALIVLLFGPSISLPVEIWLPFIAAWAGLYLWQVQTIKKPG